MTEQTENAEKEVEKVEHKTTLGKLGLKFPLQQGDYSDITFSFKDWNMETEEKLSDLQDKSKNTGAFVRGMMDMLLDTFCGQDWDSMKDAEKVMALTNLHFPNMLYMYMALRVEELGEELHFDQINCPNCKAPIKNWVGDLRTLDVVQKFKDDKFDFIYPLKKPMIIDSKTISQLKVVVTKWGALESIPSEKAQNGASVKKAMFQSSIEGALHDDKPIEGFIDLKEVIKKLKKFDIEKLQKEIAVFNGGADMVLGGECPHCSTDFIKPVEWGYETFFDSSSL